MAMPVLYLMMTASRTNQLLLPRNQRSHVMRFLVEGISARFDKHACSRSGGCFLSLRCNRGPACRFRHSAEDIEIVPARLPSGLHFFCTCFRASFISFAPVGVCYSFQSGTCNRGKACRFIHEVRLSTCTSVLRFYVFARILATLHLKKNCVAPSLWGCTFCSVFVFILACVHWWIRP